MPPNKARDHNSSKSLSPLLSYSTKDSNLKRDTYTERGDRNRAIEAKPPVRRERRNHKSLERSARYEEKEKGHRSYMKKRGFSRSRSPYLRRHHTYRKRSHSRSYSSRSNISNNSRNLKHRSKKSTNYYTKKDNFKSNHSHRSGSSISDKNNDKRTKHKNQNKSTIEIGGVGPDMVAGAAKGINQKVNSDPLKHGNSLSIQQKKIEIKPISFESEEVQKKINEEVQKQIDEEIQKRLTEYLHSASFKKELEQRLEHERQRQMVSLRAEVESEKNKILEEFRRKEEEEKRSKQQLDVIMAENEKKVRQEQIRLAEEQAKADEERLLELQRLQQINEERRKKAILEKEQDDLLKKGNNTRQKIAFKMGSGSLL